MFDLTGSITESWMVRTMLGNHLPSILPSMSLRLYYLVGNTRLSPMAAL